MATIAAPASCLRSAPRLLTRTWTATPSSLTHPCARNSINQTLRLDRYSHSLQQRPTSSQPRQHRSFHTSRKMRSAIPHISLHIAAASSGKGTKYDPEKSTKDFTPTTNPTLGAQSPSGNQFQRRRSRPDSGEDAYFVASVSGDPNTVALGVCDGVGGWQEQGINPADFSHGLTSYMAETAFSWDSKGVADSEQINTLHPQRLLETAYDSVLKDKSVRAGGSTACVAVLQPTGRLRTANLGDSGYIHLRLGTVHASSSPQTHAFNTPFQMSKTPAEIMTQAAIFGGLPLNDGPERADVATDEVAAGDVLVFATDGVWDNLGSGDVLSIVSKQMRDRGAWQLSDRGSLGVSPHLTGLVQGNDNGQKTLAGCIASAVVGEAKVASMDRKRDGPFAKAVQREYPMDRWHGGKVDDITVLVVVVGGGGEGGKEVGTLKAKL